MRAPFVLLALALPASAQETVAYSDEVPLSPAPYSVVLSLPQFDPALGVLGQVFLRGTIGLDVEAGVENLTDVPLDVVASYAATSGISAVPSPGFEIGASLDTTVSLGAFDGSIDFGGTSGTNLGSGLSSSTQVWPFSAPVDLATYTGTGQLEYTAYSTESCDIEPVAVSDGLIEVVCVPRATARVQVIYVYGPDCNGNGIADYLDLCVPPTEGPGTGECSADCNANGIPDECEPDCDGDGVPNDCDPGSCDLACEEFDRFEDLTPNDTLTLITSQHNPQQEQGYLYVFAVTPANQPVAADALVGQTLVVDGLEALQYATNAVDYRAAVAAGALTDLDGDGVRDLDGAEYEKTAGEILVPRFLGSDPQRQTRGELILIGLSGGSQFTTTADFLVYNDDEDAFSASYTFFCWEKVHTLDISNVFANQWLKDFSGQNPSKGLGNLEYGWFRVDGGVASSAFFSLLDPALYAVYVEKVGGTAAADLPFEDCTQSGHLLPRLVTGDNSETSGAPSDEDCGMRHTGRKPASLLLYPEFDNRSGVATVVTVTNTSPTDDVRTHFVYIGRYGN